MSQRGVRERTEENGPEKRGKTEELENREKSETEKEWKREECGRGREEIEIKVS